LGKKKKKGEQWGGVVRFPSPYVLVDRRQSRYSPRRERKGKIGKGENVVKKEKDDCFPRKATLYCIVQGYSAEKQDSQRRKKKKEKDRRLIRNREKTDLNS